MLLNKETIHNWYKLGFKFLLGHPNDALTHNFTHTYSSNPSIIHVDTKKQKGEGRYMGGKVKHKEKMTSLRRKLTRDGLRAYCRLSENSA